MTLMIDGRTERPVVGETYRQFFVSKEQGDAETPFDEGAVRIVTVNEDRIAFETLDEPSWVKDARPVELRDVGGVAHARTSNWNHAEASGWFRMWVPVIVPEQA